MIQRLVHKSDKVELDEPYVVVNPSVELNSEHAECELPETVPAIVNIGNNWFQLIL